ncbi:MAG: hypothetical protein JXM70_23220 [Pirellulales bacterium]|nr:hypothetical protein [Pirellulales bacterium]
MSEQSNSSIEDSTDLSAHTCNVTSKPTRRQFSLKTLFAISLVFIAICSMMATADFIFGANATIPIAVIMTLFTVPSILISGTIYSRGYRRTFFIGTIFPGIGCVLYSYFIFGMFFRFEEIIHLLLWLVAWFLLIIVGGTASIIVRWSVEPRIEDEQ